MATITEKKRNGKVVAFKFFHCIGRDEEGKQHFRTTTWKPPENLSYSKAKKMAEVEAYKWEQTLMGKGDQPHGELTSPAQEAAEAPKTAEIIQEEETFRYFAEQVWMPLRVIGGGLRPSTISMYSFLLKVILRRIRIHKL